MEKNEYQAVSFASESFWTPSAMIADPDMLVLTRHRLEQQYRTLKRQLAWTAGALTAIFVAIIIL